MDPAEEVQLYEETINEEKGELEKGIVTLRTVSPAERREHVRRLQESAKKLRKALMGYRTQVRGLKDPVKRATFERKVKEHLQDLDNWEKELRDARADPGDVANPLDPDAVVLNEKGETRQSVMKDALKVQDQSLASLARTAQLAAQSEDLAVKTNVQLKIQTEQLGRIDNDLDTLQGEIKRARKEMVWFIRNAMTDKCLVCLFGLVALAVVFLICWKIWGSSIKKGLSSSSPSPSPSPRRLSASFLYSAAPSPLPNP